MIRIENAHKPASALESTGVWQSILDAGSSSACFEMIREFHIVLNAPWTLTVAGIKRGAPSNNVSNTQNTLSHESVTWLARIEIDVPEIGAAVGAKERTARSAETK